MPRRFFSASWLKQGVAEMADVWRKWLSVRPRQHPPHKSGRKKDEKQTRSSEKDTDGERARRGKHHTHNHENRKMWEWGG